MGAESAAPVRRQRLRVGLGTFLAVEASAASAEQADAAIEAAFAAMLEVEQRMHPSREGSDLAKINASSAWPSPPIPVHRPTWDLLQLAKHLNALSDGVFDPCLPCRSGVLSDVELLPDSQVRCLAPVRLDFGGFAKGYAVDQAVEALMRYGCGAGLVNAGGDLRVFGPQVETVLLREKTGHFHPVRLSNAAIAVSEVNEARRPSEHSGYYLRTQVASNSDAVGDARINGRNVAVIANRAVLADALTKCALLCTAQQLQRLSRDLTRSRSKTSIGPRLCTTTAEIHVHCDT